MKKKMLFGSIVLFIFVCANSVSGQGMGDVNLDYSVDIIDALLVAQYYVGLVPATFKTQYADANSNGAVDIIDALLIARYYVGLIPCFPLYDYPIDSKYLVITVPVIDENS
jgi:hypothetical protein